MDTSEIYIKMCDCGEIQWGWKGTRGDWVAHKGRGIILFEKPRDLLRGDGCIWLPRQDQLQEMLDYSISTKLIGFCKWAPNQHWSMSMEQLWLAFVMKEKFQKVWDGERWVKEVI